MNMIHSPSTFGHIFRQTHIYEKFQGSNVVTLLQLLLCALFWLCCWTQSRLKACWSKMLPWTSSDMLELYTNVCWTVLSLNNIYICVYFYRYSKKKRIMYHILWNQILSQGVFDVWFRRLTWVKDLSRRYVVFEGCMIYTYYIRY
jgi:hypothetical protein